ncbi:response regulator [Christensenellaceae bacterium OttesenSCG-928-M15]|nr:response regulator [Christensenellaceae bacterium OttesenSCG-928-M15]
MHHMKRVLIVDDAAFMRVSIRNILTKNGFEVVGEAENGAVAVQKYGELKPDIVTMDITMPEMNGLEALQTIRKSDPKANVIMVSALGQEAMVRDAVMSGAKGFVVKPFKEDTITAALAKLG